MGYDWEVSHPSSVARLGTSQMGGRHSAHAPCMLPDGGLGTAQWGLLANR